MKVVFVNDGAYAYASGDPSAVGGTERDIWVLARALTAAGWPVTVGVRRLMEAGQHTSIDGVDFIGIGCEGVLASYARFISSEKPDWWFWQSASHWLGPAFEIAKFKGVRTIYSVAFDRDVEPRHALTRRRRFWPLYAWGLARADRIFVQHRGQLSGLARHLRSKAYIFPKLPNAKGQSLVVTPHAKRREYVAWVGMLRQHKRPDLLIEIARSNPSIPFIVCGGPTGHRTPGQYSKQILHLLHTTPNIEFLGRVSHEKAQQVISEAAMLLSTSDEEGFPCVFLEAWSSGTPVVSLKIDPDQIIEEKGLGAVSGDVERVSADIRRLLDSPSRRDEMAARCREHVKEAHGEAAVIQAFERAAQGVSI